MMATGFVGADPVALTGLADTAEQYAVGIAMVGAEVQGILVRDGQPATAADVSASLGSVESSLGYEADELRWRAAAIDAAQRTGDVAPQVAASVYGRAVFAAMAVFDLDNRRTTFERWKQPPDIDDLSAMTPFQVAAALGATAPSAVNYLVQAHPEVLGALDGTPPQARYTANRILLDREIQRLEAQIDEVEASPPHKLLRWLGEIFVLSPVDILTDIALEHLRHRKQDFEQWLAEDRQILLFDPAGDGRVAEVFGDLSTADNVGVVVPGITNDIENFSEVDGGFRINARDLFDSSLETSSQNVATIAWLGYDTPDHIDAVSVEAATDGAPALRTFLDGIDPGEERQITVVAHSYGSVVAGTASRMGLEANNLVVLGSPGTTLEHAADAQLRDGGRVWSALADWDPIAYGLNPSELPPWWLPPVFWPTWIGTDLANGGGEELWYGPNPASDDFGAGRISTDGSLGHSGYFDGESLENLARIVQGLYGDVDLEG
jgi:hypothetical protein